MKEPVVVGASTVRIGLVFPDLLGTYGDAGNAEVLRQRLRWRGIPAEIVPVTGDVPGELDLYVLGGGEDAAQVLAARRLQHSVGLRRAAACGAPILAVCAGFQILGERFATGEVPAQAGLGLLDVTTGRCPRRAVGEVVVAPDPILLRCPLTGFENHLGATRLGPDAGPLGRVERGVGNGVGDGAEGAVQGRMIATYLHGPVLARNPEFADLLLGWVVGAPLEPLTIPAIDDLRSRLLRQRSARGRVSGG
jgi:CobQ-like glutamine amidotransferase family enzyme